MVKCAFFRIEIFLAAVYLVLPFLMAFWEGIFGRSPFILKFGYIPLLELYPLFVMVAFMVAKRQELSKVKCKFQPIESVLFFILAYWSFFGSVMIPHMLEDVLAFSLVKYFFYSFGLFFLALGVLGWSLFGRFRTALGLSFATLYLLWAISLAMFIYGWGLLTGPLAWIIYSLLALTFPDAVIKPGPEPLVGFGSFVTEIGPLCSGIESLLAFAGLFSLVLFYERKRIGLKRASLAFLTGLTGVYFVNVLRVYLVVLFGGLISRQLAFTLHYILGAVLFIAYFFGFLLLFYRHWAKQG